MTLHIHSFLLSKARCGEFAMMELFFYFSTGEFVVLSVLVTMHEISKASLYWEFWLSPTERYRVTVLSSVDNIFGSQTMLASDLCLTRGTSELAERGASQSPLAAAAIWFGCGN